MYKQTALVRFFSLLLVSHSATIVSGHVDNHIRFWDSRTADCTNEITGVHTGQITSLAVSTDGRVVLSNSRDNTLKLIDVRMLQVVNTLL